MISYVCIFQFAFKDPPPNHSEDRGSNAFHHELNVSSHIRISMQYVGMNP